MKPTRRPQNATITNNYNSGSKEVLTTDQVTTAVLLIGIDAVEAFINASRSVHEQTNKIILRDVLTGRGMETQMTTASTHHRVFSKCFC